MREARSTDWTWISLDASVFDPAKQGTTNGENGRMEDYCVAWYAQNTVLGPASCPRGPEYAFSLNVIESVRQKGVRLTLFYKLNFRQKKKRSKLKFCLGIVQVAEEEWAKTITPSLFFLSTNLRQQNKISSLDAKCQNQKSNNVRAYMHLSGLHP